MPLIAACEPLSEQPAPAEYDDAVFEEAEQGVRKAEALRGRRTEAVYGVDADEGRGDAENRAREAGPSAGSEERGPNEGAGEGAAEEGAGRGAGRDEGRLVPDHLPDHQRLQERRD